MEKKLQINNSPDVFITGTRAYGPTTTKSDIDIVMPRYASDQLLSLLDDLNIPTNLSDNINAEYLGYSFNFPDQQTINIIAMDDMDELSAWEKVTQIMKNLPAIPLKYDRVAKFRMLLEETEGQP